MLEPSCKQTSLCYLYPTLSIADGEWTPWSEWTACSASCGPGTRFRTRECDDPPPQYGGRDCVGESNETCSCNEQECAGKPFSKKCTSIYSAMLTIEFLKYLSDFHTGRGALEFSPPGLSSSPFPEL